MSNDIVYRLDRDNDLWKTWILPNGNRQGICVSSPSGKIKRVGDYSSYGPFTELVEKPEEESAVLSITSRDGLRAFAAAAFLRPNWHEPDERGIGARIVGTHLDNAMGARLDPDGEFNVVLTREHTRENDEVPRDIAVVNLATLLSWAAEKENR